MGIRSEPSGPWSNRETQWSDRISDRAGHYAKLLTNLTEGETGLVEQASTLSLMVVEFSVRRPRFDPVTAQVFDNRVSVDVVLGGQLRALHAVTVVSQKLGDLGFGESKRNAGGYTASLSALPRRTIVAGQQSFPPV